MDWATLLPEAAKVLADLEQVVQLGLAIEPEIQTAIMLLTKKTTLTDEQRAADLANLNAMQAELDADAGETE